MSSDTQHTPGPWGWKNTPGAGIAITAFVCKMADPASFFRAPSAQDIQFHVQEGGKLIANIAYQEWVQFTEYAGRITGVDWNAMQEANAHLIAAAPDLLVACKRGLGELRCDKISGMPWTDDLRLETMQCMIDAIDKAEGKGPHDPGA